MEKKNWDRKLPIIEKSDQIGTRKIVLGHHYRKLLISFQRLKQNVYLKEKNHQKNRRVFPFVRQQKATQLNNRPCQWPDNKKKQTRQRSRYNYDETEMTGYEEIMTKHEQIETRTIFTRGQESTSENNQGQVWQWHRQYNQMEIKEGKQELARLLKMTASGKVVRPHLFWAFPYFPKGSPAFPPSPVKMYRYPSRPNRSWPPLWLAAGSSISRITLQRESWHGHQSSSWGRKCNWLDTSCFCIFVCVCKIIALLCGMCPHFLRKNAFNVNSVPRVLALKWLWVFVFTRIETEHPQGEVEVGGNYCISVIKLLKQKLNPIHLSECGSAMFMSRAETFIWLIRTFSTLLETWME